LIPDFEFLLHFHNKKWVTKFASGEAKTKICRSSLSEMMGNIPKKRMVIKTQHRNFQTALTRLAPTQGCSTPDL
jgi:hypothetical protein